MLRGRTITGGFFFVGGWLLCGAMSLRAQDVCGTEMPDYEVLRVSDPEAYARAMDFEEQVKVYTRLLKDKERAASVQEGVIRIPVVVHVVYNTPEQNISDAQIESQIAVLNEDFRAVNDDENFVPEEFSSLVADIGVEFHLASADPQGNPTNGIVRVPTDKKGFFGSNDVHYASRGGSNGWPCDQYLNIWVCDLRSARGYAYYPESQCYQLGGLDGIVIRYQYFGRAPQNPFDESVPGKALVGTHEVGHWLGLYHIWGGRTGGCNEDDFVEDTPVQARAHRGCPSYPMNSCTEQPGSDMFMNHMDYSSCRRMFSLGQKARMRTTLEARRPSFLVIRTAPRVHTVPIAGGALMVDVTAIVDWTATLSGVNPAGWLTMEAVNLSNGVVSGAARTVTITYPVNMTASARMATLSFTETGSHMGGSAALDITQAPLARLSFGTITVIDRTASVPIQSNTGGTFHYVVTGSGEEAPGELTALRGTRGAFMVSIPTANTDVVLTITDIADTGYKMHGILADGPEANATAISEVASSAVFTTEALPAGVDGEDMQSLILFPNPVDGVLELEGVDSYARLEVYDLNGALVYSQEEGSRIDLRHLPAGAYLVRVHTADGLRAVRILK